MQTLMASGSFRALFKIQNESFVRFAVSGRAECNPSAKPLVPYSLGCSVVQPRSRFSAEAAAPAAIQADPVQVSTLPVSSPFEYWSHKSLPL